jgi:PAS domain S-box-containing protein
MQDKDKYKTKDQLIDELNEMRRKSAEFEAALNKLNENESKYSEIVDKTSEAILIAQDGWIKFANVAARELTGYTEAEAFASNAIATFVHPDDQEMVAQYHARRLQGDKSHHRYDFRFICKDGNIKWVQMNSSLIMREGRPAALILMTDITGRKKAEDALRESEERLDFALKGADLGLWDLDLTSGQGLVNERMVRIIGYSPGEIETSLDVWQQFIHPDDIGCVRNDLRDHFEGRTDLVYHEYRIRTKSGSHIWVLARGKVVQRGPDGRPLRMTGTVMEITDRKMIEETLEKRIFALTSPLDQAHAIEFDELFNLDDIQRLQEQFAQATGVASIITHTDGRPITSPSNFRRLCSDIIRQTDKGLANCYKSDSEIGRYHPERPVVQPCLSGGLWDAGASITVGGRHIANWLIGQVRNETQTEENMRDYAREIGVDEEAVVQAFREVPTMTLWQFEAVAQALFTLANLLSKVAYQNVQQSRFISDRKKVEDALRESEENYRTLVEKSNLGIMISSPNGLILHANDRVAEMAGYGSAEEFVTIPVTRLYANLSDHERLIGELQAKGSVTNFECLYVKKDGTNYWVALNVILKNDDDGSPPAIHTFVEDITNRKKTEEELRISQERLKMVLDGSGEGFWDWNIETGQVHRNERWAEMLGYTIEEIQFTVTQWDTLMHPDDREAAWRSIKDHLEGRTPQHAAEYRMLTKDKQWKWILDRAKVVERDNHGKPTRMSGTHTDTTERKRAEELLHTTVQRYHAILSSLSAGVLVVTTDGRVEFVNQAFCDLFNLAYMPENLHGLTAPEMIHEIASAYAQPDVAVGRIQDIVAKGRPVKGEGISMLDGRTCMVDFVPIVVDGKPCGRLWLHYDITDRKRSEHEKLALQAQLFQSQKLQSLGTLVGGIAHDFNNMLQIMLGYSQFLLDGKKKGEPGYKELQTIIETGKGGADLVQKLLALGQQGQFFPVPLDLNHQISQLTTLISRTLPQVVHVDLDLADRPTTIRGDRSQIDQVIMNLAINASESMPNGGRLGIATKTVSLDAEYCRSCHGAMSGSFVMLTVTDTGRGMDKETLAKAFDPFFSTKERGSTRGTGLGLSVVKGIVQQQGGHVTCESEPGKGTEFKVYFPAIEAPLAPTEEVDPTVQSRGSETILVVEDSIPVAELEERFLASAGYNVIVATNGQAALDIYHTRRQEISLVVLDLLMPEMSGRDCLMELVKIDPSVKVLIASGYAPEDELHKEIRPLVKGFLHKPFAIAELLTGVGSALDGA